ncbi:MAG TPA: diguanylate cyclase [Rhodocyclaceae bacterium]|nr:diguanylate cyclase [Rhodocyclaceae bacterium]
MNYCDSVEESAEYLRLAIAHMSKQAAALHPVSYAVWYEYASGRNASLRTAVDHLTRDGAVLDERSTANLFRKHIAELDEETARRISDGFQRVMAEVSQSASQAGEHADQFGSILETWSSRNQTPLLQPADEVGALLQHTQTMRRAITTLRGRLDDSQREIEQLRREVIKAREDSLLDGLTGLRNRKAFDITLASCLTLLEAADQGPSLLIADIDCFKQINDSYGHLFGDTVIRSVAQILKDNVKGMDTAARYGGEEFVVLLPNTAIDGARRLAERIRATIERCVIKRLGRNEVVSNVTISLGVACYRLGESAQDFVARADAALYASKSRGRNCVSIAAV